MLEERFNRFADETQRVGTERVEKVNAIVDQLIGTGHSDAALIAEWKDGLNESWANLLELIETRRQVIMRFKSMVKFFRPSIYVFISNSQNNYVMSHTTYYSQ